MTAATHEPIAVRRRPRTFAPVKMPDIARLPDDALLTRAQVVLLSGFTDQALKKWAREARGPAITVVEGRPRYRAQAVRVWLSGTT